MTWCRGFTTADKTKRITAKMPQSKTCKWNESKSETLDNVKVPPRPQGTATCGTPNITAIAVRLGHRFGTAHGRVAVPARKPAPLTGKTYRRRRSNVRLPFDSQEMLHAEIAPLRTIIGLVDNASARQGGRIPYDFVLH